MREVLGILLVLSGVILSVGSAVEFGGEPGTPETVSVSDIEKGRRPDYREWWRITGAKPIHSKAIEQSYGGGNEKYRFVPYASSRGASWDDIRFIVRFNLKKMSVKEVTAYGDPVGTVGTTEASGTIPDLLIEKVPGIEKRLVILWANTEPTSVIWTFVSGALLILFGVVQMRKASKARKASPVE